ncbi:hypothetical protein C2G38_2108275 [Gigaspora rosea]|uniref:Uncharacterized protein n=1 Tax=Gigaspora rosea TaxID=44941 RepID=A0A397UK26_9GLOM|nr:hypothetical protein C2G38_2108275 [Gigaspora rosea]
MYMKIQEVITMNLLFINCMCKKTNDSGGFKGIYTFELIRLRLIACAAHLTFQICCIF